MAKLYPDAVISDILDRSNIVEVVSSYMPLKRIGRNYKACCPFHSEKTPSFIVSADKQIFHCFGCGVGGNALTFVMQYEKLNFREALEMLAQKTGIPLPEPEKTEFQKSGEDFKKNLYSLYEKAARFYAANLMKSPEAQAARSYLQKRGISKETAQKFNLGFAREGWEALITHLRTGGASLSLIEKSGLVVAKEGGGYYDRFRNRIIFTIIDLRDRVIGFGARLMPSRGNAADNMSSPKYINSPETTIYSKGKNLFGLNMAKDSIRILDRVLVVEGYLDMIVPFEAGVKNIVASLGTALTPEQIRLIKRYTNNVIMLYDPDIAGETATLRALELLIKEDVNVRIACLPQGEDPDSYVRNMGKEEFLKMVECAKPIFDYKFDLLMAKHRGSTITEKDRIIREILPMIKKFANATMKAEYIKKTAEILKLDEKALWDDLSRVKDEDFQGTDHEEKGDSASLESRALEHYRLKEIPITERMLVKLMLEEIHLVDQLRTLIDPSDFIEEKLRKIVTFIFGFFSEGKTLKPNILMSYLGDEEAINIISELATLEIHDCPNKEKLIADCVRRLKRDKLLYRCQELHKQIQEAQAQGDQEVLNKLISEYNSLIKQRSPFHGEACS